MHENEKKTVFKTGDFFVKIIPPPPPPPPPHTLYKKRKVIDFAPINISLMAHKLPSTNLEPFLRRIKSPLIRS